MDVPTPFWGRPCGKYKQATVTDHGRPYWKTRTPPNHENIGLRF